MTDRDRIDLAIRCVDLTTLEGSDTPDRVRALCATAADPGGGAPPVAAVCVYPLLVPTAVAALRDTPVKVASVAGAFPSGLSSLPVRLADIADAAKAGADEIDIVLNRSALLSGDDETVRSEAAASKDAAAGAKLKVILEVGELGDDATVVRAAELAIAGGADTIKTSTGKIAAGATLESVATMAEVVRAHHDRTGVVVGLKAAGGIRTAEEALAYFDVVAGALGEEWLHPDRFRFGASSLLAALVDARS